jgi:hypothetical protein
MTSAKRGEVWLVNLDPTIWLENISGGNATIPKYASTVNAIEIAKSLTYFTTMRLRRKGLCFRFMSIIFQF